MTYKLLVPLLLVGCGRAFTAAEISPADLVVDGGSDLVEVDATEADAAGSGGSGSGGKRSVGNAPRGSGSSPVASGGALGGSGGSRPTIDAGLVQAGGALGAGGSGGASVGGSDSGMPIEVPQPPCCVDADCPASGVPFCSPWGTCYQGGNPYNCDYDSFCESYCVHCSGSSTGACEAFLVAGHTEKRCVCF